MIYALLNSQSSVVFAFRTSNATVLKYSAKASLKSFTTEDKFCIADRAPLQGAANQKGLATVQTCLIRKTKTHFWFFVNDTYTPKNKRA